jgi:hypothetical protein
LPQPERIALLTPLLELNARTALALIHRAQLSPDDYLAIFKLGLIHGDASSVALWMEATVPHLGWRKVFSVLREALVTNPRGGAFALYHVPYVCRRSARQRALSGPLPTRELTLECIRLVVLYLERGQRVVGDLTFHSLKEALWDHNFHAHDSAGSIFVEFRLSWEDWREYRHIEETSTKALDQYRSDFLSFGAEPRQFTANEFGWKYKNSSGTARHEWNDVSGVIYYERVITLMAPTHYPLPRTAFNEAQLTILMCWLKSAMGESEDRPSA